MPNGWYPVPGLDVVLVNRTEQRYPRLEWDQSGDTFCAAEIIGPRGDTPSGALNLRSSYTFEDDASDKFESVVKETQKLLASEPRLGAGASAVLVDFEQRAGWAIGSFCVYGFKDGKVAVLHDLTLGASAPKGTDFGAHKNVVKISTTGIHASGLHFSKSLPEPDWRFDFAGFDALVVSTIALHYDAHWPPKNSLDCVVIALAEQDRRDALVALWKAEEDKPSTGAE